MCARRTTEYEEELCGPKERQRQHLDALCKNPRVASRRADFSEDVRPRWQEPASPPFKEEVKEEASSHIKEEKELDPTYIKKEVSDLPHIKKEEEEEAITTLPSIGVPWKSEDEDGQSEEHGGEESPSSSWCQHVTREGDGDHHVGSKADGFLATLSDRDNKTSHVPHDGGDDESEDEVKDKDGQGGKQEAVAAATRLPEGRRKRQRSRGNQEILEEHLMQLLEEWESNPPPPRPTCEDTLFMTSMIPCLKRLPPGRKEYVKFKIHKLLFEQSTLTLNLEHSDK
ncbi:uncharacterized protein LOC133417800 isoform X2 [Phycodurus eques]|uniref:uncharacterized protein LOC133417800 isoform X2 n=1 Tax=Phycodurus eques TaxID=693459 RepID=UPI002ACDE413|nr:uncharacterized protein LOC133417800 isoform X2 [Phycodurus eques]